MTRLRVIPVRHRIDHHQLVLGLPLPLVPIRPEREADREPPGTPTAAEARLRRAA